MTNPFLANTILCLLVKLASPNEFKARLTTDAVVTPESSTLMHQQLRSLYPSSHTWRLPSWTPWTSFGIRPHSQLASTPSTRFVWRQPRNMLYSSFQSLLPIQLPSKHTSATFSSLETRGGKTGPTHWAGLFSPLLLAGWVEVLNSSPLLGPPA